MRQLQELIDPVYEMDVSDPEADALLEATDPAVEHGPAELLERAVNQEAKATFQQAVEEELPQEQEEDGAQAELLDMEQAPRQLFRDVEAAPVKVGENFQLDTQQEDMDEVLADTVRYAAQAGLKEVEIMLNPQNLGA